MAPVSRSLALGCPVPPTALPARVRMARRVGMAVVSVIIVWTIGATAIGVFRGLGWVETAPGSGLVVEDR